MNHFYFEKETNGNFITIFQRIRLFIIEFIIKNNHFK
jgi:hypothetical protein